MWSLVFEGCCDVLLVLDLGYLLALTRPLLLVHILGPRSLYWIQKPFECWPLKCAGTACFWIMKARPYGPQCSYWPHGNSICDRHTDITWSCFCPNSQALDLFVVIRISVLVFVICPEKMDLLRRFIEISWTGALNTPARCSLKVGLSMDSWVLLVSFFWLCN